MIGVVVGVEHAVEPGHPGIEKLLAKIGRGVDYDRRLAFGAFTLHEQRAAQAPVLGIGGIARPPVVTDTRDAARCAAAEDGELQSHAALCGTFFTTRGTLLKSRKKLSVVRRAISSFPTPRTAARRAAVWATKAGSLIFPRSGSGAR